MKVSGTIKLIIYEGAITYIYLIDMWLPRTNMIIFVKGHISFLHDSFWNKILSDKAIIFNYTYCWDKMSCRAVSFEHTSRETRTSSWAHLGIFLLSAQD